MSTLLLAMLLVSLVFGYAQWRRQWLIGELQQLKAENVQALEVKDHWFWPGLTEHALVVWDKELDGKIYDKGTPATMGDAKKRYDAISARIDAMGNVEVSPALLVKEDTKTGVITFVRPVPSVAALFE